MPREAIDHALAAMDYATAVNLLEAHAMDMIMQGHAKTVHDWVEAIPADWRTHSPRTDLAFAWMHMLRGAYAQANECLERLEALLADSSLPAGEYLIVEAEWLAMQALMSNMRGDVTAGYAQASRALELAPPAESRVRSLAHFGLAGVYQLMDDYSRAVEAYQMAIRLGRQTENSVAEMMSIAGLAQMAFEHGQLHLAWEIASPASARIERSGSPPPISAVVSGVLAQILGQWRRLDEALDHALRALQLSILGGYHSGIVFYRGLLAQLLLAAGDAESAEREIQSAVEAMHGSLPADAREETVARQVRIALAGQRPVAAEMALQGYGFSYQNGFVYPDLPPDQGIAHSTGVLYNSSLRVLLHRAARRPALLPAGIDLADRVFGVALRLQRMPVAIEALILRARLRGQAGQNEDSVADYLAALELTEPEGYIDFFVEGGASTAEVLAGLARGNLGIILAGLRGAHSGGGCFLAAGRRHARRSAGRLDRPVRAADRP